MQRTLGFYPVSTTTAPELDEDATSEIEQLLEEIEYAKSRLLACLELEEGLEPNPGEEVIFEADCAGPGLENDLRNLRAESMERIQEIKEEGHI